MSRTAYVAHIRVLVDAESVAEACDAVSSMMHETGAKDWAYEWDERECQYAHPYKVTIPDAYEEGDFLPEAQ